MIPIADDIDPSLFDPPAAPALELEIEPVPDQAPAAPVALALAEILPADFDLPSLIRFVPDPRLKAALDAAVSDALGIAVTGPDGMVAADTACATVRGALKAIEAHFADPAEKANRVHKSITARRADWMKPGDDAVSVVGRRIADEKRHLDGIAAEQRRREQAEADRLQRDARQREADAAKAQGAPAVVVEQMTQAAKVATAPPVPAQTFAPTLAHTTVTKTWKARVKGTPAEVEPRPQMADLTAPQQAMVRELMAAVVAGTLPLTLFEINWSVLNDRAKGEKSTLTLPGIEAYEETGTRAKPGRRL